LAEEIKSIVPEEANHQTDDLDPEQLITKTQKAIKEEADEDKKAEKQEELEQLHELDPKLTEVVNIIQPVEKKEDFQKKVYGL
jgi:hypothetical protein